MRMLLMATGCELPVIIASTGIIQACDQDMWLDSDVVLYYLSKYLIITLTNSSKSGQR